jgi:hypothetical protein
MPRVRPTQNSVPSSSFPPLEMNQQFPARRAEFPEKTENLPLRMLIHFAPRKSAFIAPGQMGLSTAVRGVCEEAMVRMG